MLVELWVDETVDVMVEKWAPQLVELMDVYLVE